MNGEKKMTMFHQIETWIFLAAWNAVLGCYWYIRYNRLVEKLSSPYFMAMMAVELNNILGDEDDQAY